MSEFKNKQWCCVGWWGKTQEFGFISLVDKVNLPMIHKLTFRVLSLRQANTLHFEYDCVSTP